MLEKEVLMKRREEDNEELTSSPTSPPLGVIHTAILRLKH